MKCFAFLILALLILVSCNENKVYQEYIDFHERNWIVNEKPEFRFTIDDPQSSYNIYWNVRNSTQYPNSRIFVNFTLSDSAGHEVQTKLLNDILFEPKSGKPTGKSGLGDLFDHRNDVNRNFRFDNRGPYVIQLQQFMRTDTLPGIISVGIEIEKVQR